MLPQVGGIDYGVCAVGPGNGLAPAIGEIDIITPVVKPVYLATLMFKEVFHFVSLVVFGAFAHQRLFCKTGGRKKAKEYR